MTTRTRDFLSLERAKENFLSSGISIELFCNRVARLIKNIKPRSLDDDADGKIRFDSTTFSFDYPKSEEKSEIKFSSPKREDFLATKRNENQQLRKKGD